MQLIPEGTHVVLQTEIHEIGGSTPVPAGSVGFVLNAPSDAEHSYRVQTANGLLVSARRSQLLIRKHTYLDGEIGPAHVLKDRELQESVILRCVVGSRAYGLATEDSDTDRRGVYLPPAEMHWSLYGVPEQLENKETDECYWELQKFLTLALKANPNILECLYTPIIEHVDQTGEELLAARPIFLSKLAYRTYNGYVISQFRKLEQDRRNRGEIRPKHAMHLIRLLLAGIALLRDGDLPVEVGAHRDRLLAIKHGELTWQAVDDWRLALHQEFEEAFTRSTLPERPDYEAANRLLITARRRAADR